MERYDKNRYIQVAEIYKKTKSLAETGRQIGLSKERVRQILALGKEKGIIEYNPSEVPHEKKFPILAKQYSKTKVIELLKEFKNTLRAFKEMNINKNTGLAFLKHYGITRADYHDDRFKAKYIKQFMAFVDKLGHQPSTTELQESNEGRVLYNALCKYWGGIEQFRAEFGVKKEGHFVSKESYIRWLKSNQKAKLTKAGHVHDHKKDVVRLLENSKDKFMSRNDFEKELNLSQASLAKYLRQLTDEGVVQVVNLGKQLFYKLDMANSNYQLYLDEEVGAGEKET